MTMPAIGQPGAPQSTRRADGQNHIPRGNDTDRHVCTRIHERRITLGLSQQQLADLIGVTYQQAQKYERGLNRVSAGRLFDLANALCVPLEWFFEGLAAAETANDTPVPDQKRPETPIPCHDGD